MVRHIRIIRHGSSFQCSRWHLGLFSFYTQTKKDHFSGLAISLRGLLFWSIGSLVCGYLGVVSALFLVWSRDKSLDLRYGEMLMLPYHWDSIQERRANVSIDEGLQAMKNSRWADAEMLILSGLQRRPDLLAGRSQLAYFYLLTDRWALGVSLLSTGFSSRYPGLKYIEEAFSIAQEADDLGICTGWCEQLLTRFGGSMPPSDRSLIIVREAQLLFAQEKYKEVSDLAASEASQTSVGLRELETLALLKRGDADQTLAKLERWRQQHPEDAVIIARLQARALRRAGRLDEMAAQLDRVCSMASRDPAVFLDSVTERFEAGESEAAGDALEQFLIRFGFGRNANLIENAMASFSDINYVEGMDRLLRFAIEEKLPRKKMVLLRVVADLTEGEIDQSRRHLQELDNLWSSENPRDQLLRDFFRLLFAAATDESPDTRSRFKSFCRERRLGWGDFSCAIRVLARFNREKSALKVLDVGLMRYPSSYHLAALRRSIQAAVDAKAKAARPE